MHTSRAMPQRARAHAGPRGCQTNNIVGPVVAEAYKRGRAGGMQQQDFEGFTDQGRDAAWLLSTVGGDDGWDYNDWDDEYEDMAIPDEWDSMEPKYVNNKRVLLNLQINAPRVRLQGPEREDMGVVPIDEGRQIAREEGLDIVLISPDADPPVCRLCNFSKFKYEAERAVKQRQKASKGVDTKELRMRPVTEPHDYAVKLKQAKGFLQKGSKVKVSMAFSGRELRFKDQGKELMLQFVEDLAAVGKVDGAINFKTSTFSVTMAPAK